ncbi:MAG: 3-deoxy-8-phosphooctulonate synthase [Methylacidiphilales bacterium]|nr:3-deoxy-8-phosphooctulonate synthase [Candidatus Methylacidiphilales bacterium]
MNTIPFMVEKKQYPNKIVKVDTINIGNLSKIVLIAGPCAIESKDLAIETAGYLQQVTSKLNISFIYKSSFDKANRSSHLSPRGVGIEHGLSILEDVKKTFNIPVLTDVHEDSPLAEVASVVDVIQTPAFLCRQTNFITRVASLGKPVNIKKGQFMSPWDMKQVILKIIATNNHDVMVCERGASFGYNNLISDPRSITVMKSFGYPVIFDATHSVQLPGAQGTASGGVREFVPTLARAAVANGVAGVFIETHPDPVSALSDGANAWPMYQIEELLKQIIAIDNVIKDKQHHEYY